MKISQNIHLLKHDFLIPLSPDKKLPRFVNSYIFFGESLCLIDSGVAGSSETIFRYIQEQGRNPDEITHLVLSHAHPDHIGSAAEIKAKTGCITLAHIAEQSWFENIELQNRERPVPGFFELVKTSVKIDRFVSHNDEIRIDKKNSIKIYHTPGHSAGSVSVYVPADKLLFTGDAIPLPGDLPNYYDYKSLLRSLDIFESHDNFEIQVSSWAEPKNVEGTKEMIRKGREYIGKLDGAIKKAYEINRPGLENCRMVVESLDLPVFFINPIVDKSFKSHLIN